MFSGTVVRLQERILYTTFLDRKFCLIAAAAESYKDPSKDSAPTSANAEKAVENKAYPNLNGRLNTCPVNSGSDESKPLANVVQCNRDQRFD